ncbi:MAG: hypothetical protein R6V46_18395 [Desulfatiglandaceae bacterium]
MKLEKAMAAARRMRKEGGLEPVGIFESGKPAKTSRKAWRPPVYTESKKIQVDENHLRTNACVCIDPEAVALDFYKVLRTKIEQAARPRGWNTVMITSPFDENGRTMVAVNLALTFAKAYNQTVMLVDCDLRRQGIREVLCIESDSGLVDYLLDEKPLKDAIVWPGIEKMTLISGGRTIHDSTELLGSERMRALVHEMKGRYSDRYVLFAAPPILVGADALSLAPLVDCIVMVVTEGKSSMRDVRKAIGMLPQEKFLGFVMTK